MVDLVCDLGDIVYPLLFLPGDLLQQLVPPTQHTLEPYDLYPVLLQ